MDYLRVSSTASPVLTFLVIGAISIPLLFAIISVSRRANRNLPPGPRPSLFTSSAPSNTPIWKRINALNSKFGHVASTYRGKTLIVALGTIKAATDLLEKRGRIYSSRPRNIMAGEILSGGMRGLGMQYGQRWRGWRALIHAGMGIEASQAYKPLQEIESSILLRELLTEDIPMKFASFYRRFAISIAFCISYGRRIQSLDDPIVIKQQETDECYQKYTTQGQYIVESWPILLKLPRFMQWFRYEAEAQRKVDTKLFMSLMERVQEDMNNGVARPSTARHGLQKQTDFELSDLEIAYALSAPFGAGVSTVTSTLEVFFLAALHYPDVMRKAQSEIESVLGSDRLPTFEDADSLPYVKALIREVMRWRPIAPLGIPHSNIEDDSYESMHIPKDSVILANISMMSKDSNVFSSPDIFDPERYLAPGPHSTFYFGFGRRICPGLHVAQNSLLIIISRILWAFDILPVRDHEGKPVVPSANDFIGGLVIRPAPFVYELRVRSEEKREMIQRAAVEADIQAAQWQ